MNNHQKRLIFGFAIAILVLTALFLLLTKTALAITAYCFSLLAPIMFFGTLLLVASGTKNKYITNVAFPIQARSYSSLNLIVCGIFVLLEQTGLWGIPAGWFAFIQIILIALFAWRILAMDAGQEEILRVEKNVQLKTTNWKMIGADVEALKNEAPDACRKDLQGVIDSIRYADPMTCPELESIDESIKDNVLQLELKIKEQKMEDVSLICMKIQRQIKDRNTRAKILK